MPVSHRFPMSTPQLEAAIQGNQAQGDSFASLWGLLQQSGYTSQSQVAQQLKLGGWSNQQIASAMNFKPSFVQKILGQLGRSFVSPPGVAGTLAEGGAATGAAAEGAAGGAASGVAKTAGVAALAAAAISSPLDFLKLIAWLFHPQNWLRMVEFIIGIAMIGLGLRATSRTLQGRPSAPVLTSLPRPGLPGSSRRRAERQGRRQAQRAEARTQERIRIRENN